MGTFCEIILELENDLSRMKKVSEKLPDQMEYAIGHCKIALDRMRELVINHGFPDQESEIYFFKKIKPTVYSKLLYYRAVFDLESKCQKADTSVIRRYLQKRLYKINEYMEEHQVKVQYFKCGYKHLDEKYFVRGTTEIPLELRGSHHLMDEDFFTWHDHTFSVILANEMLTEYIRKELERIDRPAEFNQSHYKSPLKWTGHKIDLGEIIYALLYSGVVNNGNASIIELAEAFEQIFNVEIKEDIYRYRLDIQRRKIERTKFLNQLIAILRRMIDEKDE
ncbi:tetracycline resistance element mobilization regulatory protein rteC [Aquipluma nitroreducens]|uniref:Tetracycline resistance element mobilization regulatory protein rteC n=1 Tax=Aquipluma nitroreducens TaxID=2010828 RepID=A0A5K7SE71_9BACT|nr:RteC domain-containing protein [Aquipluma nitroreducens]BBE19912.1 tetracycline resistance element mobilization regulatory protein rteC [Aquipluma nitroreducens]